MCHAGSDSLTPALQLKDCHRRSGSLRLCKTSLEVRVCRAMPPPCQPCHPPLARCVWQHVLVTVSGGEGGVQGAGGTQPSNGPRYHELSSLVFSPVMLSSGGWPLPYSHVLTVPDLLTWSTIKERTYVLE